jgi:uncharacterized membrane protein YfcA
MQIMILVGTICVFFLFLDKKIIPTIAVFIVMQLGAVFGAYWGQNLKARFDPKGRRMQRLPLE